ncbi:MAG: hypothetical protein QM702_12510 [Rubrivivax sp.]
MLMQSHEHATRQVAGEVFPGNLLSLVRPGVGEDGRGHEPRPPLLHIRENVDISNMRLRIAILSLFVESIFFYLGFQGMLLFSWRQLAAKVRFSLFPPQRRRSSGRPNRRSYAPAAISVCEPRILLSGTTYQDYSDTANGAASVFNSATQAAASAYNSAVDAADAALGDADDAAWSTYSTAVDSADATYQSAMQSASGTYGAAIDGTTATYNTAVTAAWDTYDTAVDTADAAYESAAQAAVDGYDGTMDAADATYAAAVGAPRRRMTPR